MNHIRLNMLFALILTVLSFFAYAGRRVTDLFMIMEVNG